MEEKKMKAVTIRIENEVHRKFKVLCAEKNISMKDYISDLINKELNKEK